MIFYKIFSILLERFNNNEDENENKLTKPIPVMAVSPTPPLFIEGVPAGRGRYKRSA